MRFATLACSIALAACEHGVNLSGTVEVSTDVQSLYSGAMPGIVEIAAVIPKTGLMAAQLAVLCEPTDAPLVIPYELDDFGCAQEATLDVWVVMPGEPNLADCGIAQDVSFRSKPAAVDASASATIFTGKIGGRCQSGEAVVDFVLD